MAITIRTYYKTTQVDEEQLRQSIQRCSNQDQKVYELFKTFGSMTKWDAYDLYCELHSPILNSSVGRSIASLLSMGVITKGEQVDGDMGVPNTLYSLVSGSPDELTRQHSQRVPKSISVKIEFEMNENGQPQIAIEKMYDEFEIMVSKLVEKYG
jgi:predicted transcriptional regulator